MEKIDKILAVCAVSVFLVYFLMFYFGLQEFDNMKNSMPYKDCFDYCADANMHIGYGWSPAFCSETCRIKVSYEVVK